MDLERSCGTCGKSFRCLDVPDFELMKSVFYCSANCGDVAREGFSLKKKKTTKAFNPTTYTKYKDDISCLNCGQLYDVSEENKDFIARVYYDKAPHFRGYCSLSCETNKIKEIKTGK